jgi:hypothetical protein
LLERGPELAVAAKVKRLLARGWYLPVNPAFTCDARCYDDAAAIGMDVESASGGRRLKAGACYG